jgi:two-component system sensor histidine kinase RpfC
MTDPTRSPDVATADEREFDAHRARVAPLRLLVVDDQSSSRILMQYLLNRAGHQAKICANADRALDFIADEVFDAVLLDVHMPGMSGIELVRELRDRDHQQHPDATRGTVPVVFVSGDFSESVRGQIAGLDATACLSKPIMATALLAALEQIRR